LIGILQIAYLMPPLPPPFPSNRATKLLPHSLTFEHRRMVSLP